MKIALDLDGVLADLQHTMIEETTYTSSDFQQWDKPDYNHFMSEASRVWSDLWDDIPPVEDHLDIKTDILHQSYHVDIVTNTAGPDEAITQWLDTHGIVYGSIVRPYSQSCDKQHLDYDVYIDDKPGMAGTVRTLYLRDRFWNQSERGHGPRDGGSNGDYIYDSYEDSYIDSEGFPENHIESDVPNVVRVTNLHDVIHDLERNVP
jgi:hypothetical protein